MLHGIHIRSRRVVNRTPWGEGEVVTLAPTKVHLMNGSRRDPPRPSKTLCGIKIPWRMFGQSVRIPEDVSCLRCKRAR